MRSALRWLSSRGHCWGWTAFTMTMQPRARAMTEALLGLAAMLALSFLRVPIAISMGLVGFLGLWWMRGLGPSMASATTVVYESGFQYTLSVVPLFILMGNFVTRAGMSKELYRAGLHLRRPPARRPGDGDRARLRRLRRDLRLVDRDRGDDDEGRLPVDARPRLLRRARGRHDLLGRHARHPDSAVDHHGHLRDHDRDQHRQAVRRRHPARAGRDGLLCLAVQYITWRDPAAGPGPSARPGASASARSRTCGPSPRSSSSSWAASTAASSPRPKAPESAPSARSASRWRGASFAARAARRAGRSARTTAMLFMILVGALVFANFVNYTTMPADLRAFVTPLPDHPMTVMSRSASIYVDPRHGDGRAVDDPADGAGVLPARRRPRLRPGVVRHHHRRRRADRPDQPAGRHEHVRRQEHAAGRRDARPSSAA